MQTNGYSWMWCAYDWEFQSILQFVALPLDFLNCCLNCLVCMYDLRFSVRLYISNTRHEYSFGGFKIERIFCVPINMDLCSMWNTQNTVRSWFSRRRSKRIEIRLCIANATKLWYKSQFSKFKRDINVKYRHKITRYGILYSLEFEMLFSTKYSMLN